MELSHLINLQLEIFILMFIGYLLTKKGILNKQVRAGLTDLVIYLMLPANIIYSFLIDLSIDVIIDSGIIFLVSLLLQLFCHIFTKYFFPHANSYDISVLQYATLCSNAGFMGNPIVLEIYGHQGLLFASIFLIPQRIIMWSAGIRCFDNQHKENILKKIITHPCIVAVILGLFLLLFQIKLPLFMTKTIQLLSQCTTALSMIIIGSILSDISIKSVMSPLTLYYSFIRLIFIPCIVLLACYLLKLPYLVSAVSIVLAGMPAGTTTAILAEKYHANSKLAVKVIFVSTLFSLITLPLLCYFIEYLFVL